MPADGDGPNTTASTRSVTVTLSPGQTRALLQDVPGAYRTQINDVLLAALGRVLARWTGGERVLIDLEGHGREQDLLAGSDLSRTVGWFTAIFPVALSVPPGGWDAALKSVKEQLRAVPHRGLGYGALRYLADGTDAAGGPGPAVSFNYLGRLDQAFPAGGLVHAVHHGLDAAASPDTPRAHQLDVTGRIEDQRLQLTWTYSTNLHHQATITALAGELVTALREITAHCTAAGAGGRTPSDFPLAHLDQATTDRLAGDGRSIDDIYPLTPMQAGLVFHSLSQHDQGLYLEQITFVIDGMPDPAVLAAAWQQAVDRTPILRTAISWENVAEPLQIVHCHARLPVTRLDWGGHSEAARRDALTQLLADDRAAGLDLATPPLMRLALARLPGTEVQVVWTFHHVLLDGWSVFHVLTDVFAAYAALATGHQAPLTASPPFRDYLHWLARQDRAQAESYWRDTLAGFDAPTPLPYDQPPAAHHAAESARCQSMALAEEASGRLYGFAQRNGLTMNTLMQGAWALLLSRYTGQRDVVFGATVSGRPADLPGASEMTGLFINTLPVRARVDDARAVTEWLQSLQYAQAEARQHDAVPLSQVQACADLPDGSNLFDSIVVFENYPIDQETAAAHGLRVRDLNARETTNYPLSIVASPGPRLRLDVGYDPALFAAGTIERMAGHLVHVLDMIAADPGRLVGEVPLLPEAERARVLGEWNDTAHAVTPATLAELFGARVADTPDAPAVIFDGGSLSYAELDRRASRLAHVLIQRGVGPERVVALALPRSVEIVVAELAVAKAGAAFLPVDPAYPAERIAFMLADARPVLTLTRRDVAGEAGPDAAAVLVVDDPDTVSAVNRMPDHVPAGGRPAARAANPAYVIYTSGSTGRPKGVVVSNAGLASFAAAEAEHYQVRPGDRVLQFSSPSFDASVLELCMSLPAGAALVVPPPGPLLGEQLAGVLTRQRVTHALIPPAALATVPAEMVEAGCWTSARSSSAAMPAPRGWADQWAPSRRMINSYGPTEATVVATWSDPLVPAAGCPADRPADLEHPGLRARPAAQTGTGWRAG